MHAYTGATNVQVPAGIFPAGGVIREGHIAVITSVIILCSFNESLINSQSGRRNDLVVIVYAIAGRGQQAANGRKVGKIITSNTADDICFILGE